ncbi:hypothetical protein [Actinomadura viridis]|uniref:Uncharacterized protein n=1 Tax=Actinomadura viridis TaxID=58110 RepID=A0A931DES9_9ACTN|nr:hypothetical protein [Actinomadura viridis]MBG6086997.1 hypothetical protein [Actinomadura viridis]
MNSLPGESEAPKRLQQKAVGALKSIRDAEETRRGAIYKLTLDVDDVPVAPLSIMRSHESALRHMGMARKSQLMSQGMKNSAMQEMP